MNGSPPLSRTTLLPGIRAVHQQLLDLALGDARVAGLLADVEQLGVRAGPGQRLRGNQAVVQDHVGAGDELEGPGGHQAGVARPGADQVDDAGAGRPFAGCAHFATPIASAISLGSTQKLLGSGALHPLGERLADGAGVAGVALGACRGSTRCRRAARRSR